ncbi:hypothetical protein ABZ883_26815 [Streptomyces sp. NPDC046977]
MKTFIHPAHDAPRARPLTGAGRDLGTGTLPPPRIAHHPSADTAPAR